MKRYVEPIGWLFVCLLIVLIAAVAITPRGTDNSQSQLKTVSNQSALAVER